jgi:hypothetical protein
VRPPAGVGACGAPTDIGRYGRPSSKIQLRALSYRHVTGRFVRVVNVALSTDGTGRQG